MPRWTETVVVNSTVNGEPVELRAEARTLLSDVLRLRLGLTGTHVGCAQGACGACTVLVDGVAVRSCLMLVGQIDRREIRTIEGLHGDDRFEAVATELALRRALQCGFCTPGIAVTLTALATRSPVSEEMLLDQLAGHLCRCTGYADIVCAAKAALDVETTQPGEGLDR